MEKDELNKSANPRQTSKNADDKAQESFRQNASFAEKILAEEGIFSCQGGEHDIRKLARERIEGMLNAEHLLPLPLEEKQHVGRSGINQWIWDHKISKDIAPDILKEYLESCISNNPWYFYVKLKAMTELQVEMCRFHKLPALSLTSDHFLQSEALQHLAARFATSKVKKLIVGFLQERSEALGLLEEKAPLTHVRRQGKKVHPRAHEYFEQLVKEGISKDTQRHFLEHAHHLFSWLSKNMRDFNGIEADEIPIFQITATHLEEFRAYLLKKVREGTYSKITFCHCIYLLRSFFRFLSRKYGFPAPIRRFKAITAPRYKQRDLPSDEEIKLFFEAVDTYSDEPIIERIGYSLMLFLGLRLNETAQLTWKDINISTGTISILSKGGKPHLLPLPKRVLEDLKSAQRQQPSGKYLLGTNLKTIALRLYRNFKLYSLIAGWTYPGGVHFFRHIFISRLGGQNILPQAIKELSRVVELNTVSLYMHLAQQKDRLLTEINKLQY
ncbi:site-specific integrase [Cohnella pontilimi]|uniref:Site-specific integrase n=1 Tax=Cohnella pontilimi TaxID=2564100 RepID=A0A4U0FD43_9BACL|nr:site-specific integrase [Cohnella pontilimi]TJY42671.1 site-specific integrase [Cohnella pontilimi]